jgi:[ribosomal protein S5]-alanine N-acetyltransferase
MESLHETTLRGSAVYLRPLLPSDAQDLLALRVRNRTSFARFEPIPTESHFTLDGQLAEIDRALEDAQFDRRYAFGIFTIAEDRVAGRIALSNVARGAWQNATVGYYVDSACSNRGYATEALRLVLRFAFADAGLHRVQAGVLPENTASARVLEKAGFRREGISLRYLNIFGEWRDHLMYAITVEEWDEETPGYA